MNPNAFLILEDGGVWPGCSFGAEPPLPSELSRRSGDTAFDGEVIFNTGMTGYHEILTDPSYTGQIVMMTYPHIGNYGDDDEWSEVGPERGGPRGGGVRARGLVVRSVHRGPVPPGRQSVSDFLLRHRVCGISEVDTRALTLHFRDKGSCIGIIVRAPSSPLSEDDRAAAAAYLKSMPPMTGRNLIGEAGVDEAETVNPEGSPHIALLDCGVKMNIIRELTRRGCRVTVMPSGAGAREVKASGADAFLISNGPGDPEPLDGPAALARDLIGGMPLWGICLGHQLLARAAGASTYKMTFGHHGMNHPVRDEETGRVFVTSQNHGFAVDETTLPPGCRVRFRNANDGSVEGLENPAAGVYCVQHHPEASPGPADSGWVFDWFLETLRPKPLNKGQ